MKASIERKYGLLFISPFLIGFAAFVLYPVGASLVYSFCNYDIVTPPKYIGVRNYADLMGDELFLKSLYNTLFFTVFSVPLTMVTAMGLAFLLNLKLRGQALYRTIFFLPSIVPVLASAVLWAWLLNTDSGIINAFLRPVCSLLNGWFGTDLHPPAWLFDKNYLKPALILMSLWGVGGSMILYLAALGDVPKQLYEAAELDGAGTWRKTWHITMPMISPSLFFTLVMGMIGSFQYFSQAWVMAPNGQPEDSGLFYALYLFMNAFAYLRMGYASAQAWILFIVIVVSTVLVFRSTRKFVYYGGEG